MDQNGFLSDQNDTLINIKLKRIKLSTKYYTKCR